MRTLVLLVCAFAVSPSVVTSQEVEPSPSAARPVLVDDVPDGANWVANASTRVYRAAATAETPPTSPSTPPPGVQPADGKRSRKGFWFNGGLGYGIFGCRGCDGRTGDLSGGLALGWSLSQKVLLGVGANGWSMSENGGNLSAGILGAVIRLYPSATGRFFLLGGFGVGAIHGKRSGLEGETQTGYGGLVGLGYDILVGNSVSLTPFWNGFAANTPETDFSVWQIGLGVTVH
jgi:hypothetical protein